MSGSRLPLLTPTAYARVAYAALAALSLIVLTGAAVRLTGSGLGCPDWPRCYGRTLPPLDTYALIEFGNRALSGLVGIAAVAAGLLAFRRRPFRRDLAVLGCLLPLGVVCQAVLGGFTVEHHLAPGFVMAHFGLSMVILIGAVALAWRARPGFEAARERPRADRRLVWTVRALAPLGAVTLLAGMATTASGPHAGGKPHQAIDRLDWKGPRTLDWAVHQHGRIATALGVAAVAVWLLLWRRGVGRRALRPLTALCLLLAAQGGVGALQYALKLPAELVWLHVLLATSTWLAILWTFASADTLAGAPAGLLAEPQTSAGPRRRGPASGVGLSS